MLGLGLACSNALAMFRPVETWPDIYKKLIGDVPQPPTASDETPEMLRGYADRINAAFDVSRGRIEEYRPDAIVVIGDDPGAIFTGVQVPQICVYTGTEIAGATRDPLVGEDPAEGQVTLQCNQALGNALNEGLVDEGFDITYSQFLNPQSSESLQQVGARSIVLPMTKLTPDLNIPVVPIFLNAHRWPAPSGHRCYELGKAIARVLQPQHERVAVLASGGLSNDPLGPRAGWVDTPMDQWVLDQMARGRGERLKPIFDVDSDAVRGGTGTLRQWIAVTGACEELGGIATVVDYVPVHHAVTGLGFAYWSLGEA